MFHLVRQEITKRNIRNRKWSQAAEHKSLGKSSVSVIAVRVLPVSLARFTPTTVAAAGNDSRLEPAVVAAAVAVVAEVAVAVVALL